MPSELSRRLKNATQSSDGEWHADCPVVAHKGGGKVVWLEKGPIIVGLKCWKCKATRKQIFEAVGLTDHGLPRKGAPESIPPLKLEDLAAKKKFPLDFLLDLGVYQRGSLVAITYHEMDGSKARRYQLRNGRTSGDRFIWDTENKGQPQVPYGLDHLADARAAGELFLVEGPSDCWAGWYHHRPVLGIPGANRWDVLQAEHLVDIGIVTIIQEPGEAGESFVNGGAVRLKEIGYTGKTFVGRFADYKDLCAVHEAYPDPESPDFLDIVDDPYFGEPLDLPADLPAVITGLPRGAQRRFEFNPRGNADRLRNRFEHDLLYVEGMGALDWTGQRWKRDVGGHLLMRRGKVILDDMKAEAVEIQRNAEAAFMASEAVQAILAENVLTAEKLLEHLRVLAQGKGLAGMGAAARWAKALTKGLTVPGLEAQLVIEIEKAKLAISAAFELEAWRHVCSKWAALNEMAKLIRDEDRILTDKERMDAKPMLLTVMNGTIDLTTGKKRDSERDDLLTRRSPVTFDPEATCPRWEQFVSEIMGDRPEWVAFLQRLVGYWITGETKEEIFPVFWGSGGNGKTKFLEAIRGILGDDYATTTPIETLLAHKKGGGQNATPYTARLDGMRFVTASEIDEDDDLAAGVIKSQTGREKMTGRHLYEEPTDFVPTHKYVLAVNTKPGVTQDPAMWRRLILVPFTNVWVRADEAKPGDLIADPNLGEALHAEQPGILNWAIKGSLKWQEVGLDIPTELLAVKKEWKGEADNLRDFYSTCALGPDHREVVDDFYTRYREQAEEKFPLSKKALTQETKRRYPDVEVKVERVPDPRPGTSPGHTKTARVLVGIGPVTVATDVTGENQTILGNQQAQTTPALPENSLGFARNKRSKRNSPKPKLTLCRHGREKSTCWACRKEVAP